MRTVYLGTSPFAVAVLERLAASDHRPVLVVTRPDRPRGRGRKLASPPVAEAARELGIDLIQPDSVNSDEARAAISAAEPDAVAICAFGAYLRDPLLTEHPFWNVHPSLLPRWRGAAPIERALMAGDARTGVTIHRTTPELDAGPIAAQEAFDVRPDDDAGAIYARSAEIAARLIGGVLPVPAFTPQPSDGATYAEKIAPADRELDLSRPAAQLVDHVRALSPHIGARAVLDGRPLVIWTARNDDGTFVPVDVQPEGGKRMPYDAYLRGLR
jgi:methionyl-tRNA formyltransferase